MTQDALAPLPAPPGTDPQLVADRITARARSSFAAGMRLMSRPRAQAMRALYAFARVLDDIADGDLPVAEKRRLMTAWREEVGRIFGGAPVSAIGQALAGPAMRYRLPEAEFRLLIDGMEMDAGAPIAAPAMAELRAYTRRAAGTIGMLSIHIFGAWRGAESETAALRLGDAFQLTNILRDLAEDAARGRLYLPAEALESAGISEHDPAAVARHPRLGDACAWLGDRAAEDFRAARRALARHSRAAVAPALMMTGVYEGYLAALARCGFRPGAPVSLSRGRKLWLGLRALLGPVAPARND
jgi:phytoene synthase